MGAQLFGVMNMWSATQGYHYYRRELDAMPDPVALHARRGAHWTFNATAFVAAMRRVWLTCSLRTHAVTVCTCQSGQYTAGKASYQPAHAVVAPCPLQWRAIQQLHSQTAFSLVGQRD